jgi:hypothetical protein
LGRRVVVVIIAVDQKSLNTFKELLMFWHPYFAEAMKAAADGGAKVMGLDWQFTVDIRDYEPDHDQMLAQAYIETIQKMPIVYERAYGGIGWPDNPYGVGFKEGTGEPTVLDPFEPARTATIWISEPCMARVNTPTFRPLASGVSRTGWMPGSPETPR